MDELRFYKVMQGDEFIGVGSSNDLRVYQKLIRQMVVSDLSIAEYIRINGMYYHDVWMVPIWQQMVDYEYASVTEISEEEFRALEDAQNVEEVIELIEQYEPEETDTQYGAELEFVRDQKIKQMSAECRSAIINGVDIENSDGTLSHYSFKLEDQIELMQIINDGQDLVLYHADDEVYRQYTLEQIQQIYDEFIRLKNENRIYFNALKQYIQSLSTIEAINQIYYGIQIPD